MAQLFRGSDRGEAVVLGEDPTAASALKMAYAAWTKGTAALLLAVEAVAMASGVEDQLFAEWRRSQPDVTRAIGSRPPVPSQGVAVVRRDGPDRPVLRRSRRYRWVRPGCRGGFPDRHA